MTISLTENAIKNGEGQHDDAARRYILCRLYEGLDRPHVAEANCCQCHEAEVDRRSQPPVLGQHEDQTSAEDEYEHDDEVNHNWHLYFISRHVSLCANVVQHD